MIKHGEREDQSAGKLVVPKLPIKTMNEEQGTSESGKVDEREDEEKEDRQPEDQIEQDPGQVVGDDNEPSVGDASNLDFNFTDEEEEETETLAGTAEPAEDETSTLESPSAFMNAANNLPESSSPGKIETTRK